MHSVLIKETQCSGEEEDSIVGRSSGRQSCHHLINSHTSPLNNNEKRDGA